MQVIAISSKLAPLFSSPFGSHTSQGVLSGNGDPYLGHLRNIIIVSISSLVMLVADITLSWTHAAILELRFKAKFSRPVCNHNSDLQ